MNQITFEKTAFQQFVEWATLDKKTYEKVRLIAQTLCLAVKDKGIWQFEAIQRIAPSAQNDPPLQILKEALLQNSNISPLDLMEGDCVD